MALLKISDCFLNNPELFDIIVDAFDFIEKVNTDYNKITTFRVLNEYVPKEDIQICPEFYKFEGCRPFILHWDISR